MDTSDLTRLPRYPKDPGINPEAGQLPGTPVAYICRRRVEGREYPSVSIRNGSPGLHFMSDCLGIGRGDTAQVKNVDRL